MADCHRNRYHECIYHACQARGVRKTWRNRLHYHWRELAFGFWIMLGLALLAMLTAWAFHMLLPPVWLMK